MHKLMSREEPKTIVVDGNEYVIELHSDGQTTGEESSEKDESGSDREDE